MMGARRIARDDVCETLEHLLRTMLSGVVDDDEAISISSGGDAHTIAFVVTVVPNRYGRNETGRIIGKQGQTIGSIRRILHITAVKYQYQAVVELYDWYVVGRMAETPARGVV